MSNSFAPQPYSRRNTLNNIYMSNNEIVKAASSELQKASNVPNPLSGPWARTAEQIAIAKTYEGRRIRDFDTAEMEMLVEVIGLWRFNIGAANDSTADELVIVCRFIYDNFGHFTLNDIREAMNMVVSGNLTVEYVSMKSLSPYYVSKALRVYEEYKRGVVNELALEKENYIRRAEQRKKIEITPEERAENFKNHLLEVYADYKKTGRVTDIGDMIYTWGRSAGLVKTSDDVVKAALEFADARYKEFKQSEGILWGASDTDVNMKKKFAREYVLKTFFDKWDIKSLAEFVKVEQFTSK